MPDPTALIVEAVRLVPDVRDLLSLKALLMVVRHGKAVGDLTAINAAYHDDITQALLRYMEGGTIAVPKNMFKRATVEAFGPAFDLGYQDGGGELPTEADANDWLVAQVDAELGYVEQLFQQAKQLKKEPDFDAFAWASARADGYTGTLQGIYSAGKMWAAKFKMLTWQYGETEHCDTCLSLHGQRHQARWYLARDYIPRKPGSAMDCGGYQCQCVLLDNDGNEYTIA